MQVARLFHKAFGFSNAPESTSHDHTQPLLRSRLIV
jgi:hypothetical protein